MHAASPTPVSPDHLRAVYKVWPRDPVSYDKVMLWAAICMGFFGFLRSGEFTATPTCCSDQVISVSDISVDSRSNPQVVIITLRYSKTDQAGKGRYLGRTGDTLCNDSLPGIFGSAPSVIWPIICILQLGHHYGNINSLHICVVHFLKQDAIAR